MRISKQTMTALAAIAIVYLSLFAVYMVSTHARPNHEVVNSDSAIKPQQAPVLTKYEQGPPDAQELLELVNYERVKAGTRALIADERIVRSAQIKADDMNLNNYFAHTNKQGAHGYQLIYDEMGSECSYASENIAMSDRESNYNSQAIFDSWMDSKSHYTAIMDPAYKYTGVAVAQNYVVEHFCKP